MRDQGGVGPGGSRVGGGERVRRLNLQVRVMAGEQDGPRGGLDGIRVASPTDAEPYRVVEPRIDAGEAWNVTSNSG